MREIEEQMIALMRTIAKHLDGIVTSLEMIEGRLTDLADALAGEEEDDDAAN